MQLEPCLAEIQALNKFVFFGLSKILSKNRIYFLKTCHNKLLFWTLARNGLSLEDQRAQKIMGDTSILINGHHQKRKCCFLPRLILSAPITWYTRLYTIPEEMLPKRQYISMSKTKCRPYLIGILLKLVYSRSTVQRKIHTDGCKLHHIVTTPSRPKTPLAHLKDEDIPPPQGPKPGPVARHDHQGV